MHRKTDLHSLNDRGLYDDWDSIRDAKSMTTYVESYLERGTIADPSTLQSWKVQINGAGIAECAGSNKWELGYGDLRREAPAAAKRRVEKN